MIRVGEIQKMIIAVRDCVGFVLKAVVIQWDKGVCCLLNLKNLGLFKYCPRISWLTSFSFHLHDKHLQVKRLSSGRSLQI